jgi:5-methylcytosine-specific restriction endonuclease McrA
VRQLSKGPEPDVLSRNSVAWTQEYSAAVEAGSRPLPSRWRHPDIVSALSEETRSKCAYCEAIIADVSYPHVEHIFPKSSRPDLVVRWPNLTMGCSVCNTKKGDYYDEGAPLLHPYEDDASAHLEFRGPALFAALGDGLGERTVTRLTLMRSALVAERLKRLQMLHVLLERWVATEGPDKYIRAAVIHEALGDDEEFVTCLRAHAASFGFPVRPADDP